MLISSNLVIDKLHNLKEKGVKIPVNISKNLGKRPHWWELNTTISIIEILSERVEFNKFEIEPNIKNGDVDLSFNYHDKDYQVQIKSPEFFKTKVSKKVDEELDFFYQTTKERNLAYVGWVSNSENCNEAASDNANFYHINYHGNFRGFLWIVRALQQESKNFIL